VLQKPISTKKAKEKKWVIKIQLNERRTKTICNQNVEDKKVEIKIIEKEKDPD